MKKICASSRDEITRGKNNEITNVKGTITPDDVANGGTATNKSSRDYARSMGAATDDAGHTRGNQLGGSGGKDYVFPQDPHTNRGTFQVFEGKVADYVRDTGNSVTFEQTYHYDNGGTRPTRIDYKVYDNGISVFDESFSKPLPTSSN
nr:DNA/RNA non-specific endonuclease [Gilliamella apicola]